MRNVIDLQMRLGEQAIGAIELEAESRDDIPRILRGLHLRHRASAGEGVLGSVDISPRNLPNRLILKVFL
ncbi:MAG: hypothetical protein BECKG1743D_GA0114223_108912 [Candidatus Kentron sp. G]|nr:MAG: hypothetical protein BECKG1743F_GA0114225_111282 [Candidatus Kentron sp. G]VFN06455.1 MAG: hypothetical protein BECKG1743E_GA0114224_110182 [Candidatus Kentron sp. G]VFN06625.1 MAG: hypothetical protein BECKG1743D_GA0114223_108912 [Candidatus Kentron sp. G]